MTASRRLAALPLPACLLRTPRRLTSSRSSSSAKSLPSSPLIPTTSRRLAALLLLVAAVIAVTSLEFPRTAEAQTSYLVSNLGENDDGDTSSSGALAQGFRTGSTASGYYINEVVLSLDRAYTGSLEMELWDSYHNSTANARRPNSKVFTFTSPSNNLPQGDNTFVAPAASTPPAKRALLPDYPAHQRFQRHVLHRQDRVQRPDRSGRLDPARQMALPRQQRHRAMAGQPGGIDRQRAPAGHRRRREQRRHGPAGDPVPRGRGGRPVRPHAGHRRR